MIKKSIFIVKVFLISTLILIINTNSIFASPILSNYEIIKISTIVENKIKEIEEESDFIVNLSKDSLQAISIITGISIAAVGLVYGLGFVSARKDIKEERKEFKEERKEYTKYIEDAKLKLDNYKTKINELKFKLHNDKKIVDTSISAFYEKIGDFNIEEEKYNLALINYRKSVEFNDENNDAHYKLGREIERAGHNIPQGNLNGIINEVWLENKKEALSYYERLINKNNLMGYIGKTNILAGQSCGNCITDETDSAIDYCEQAIKLCDNPVTKAKIYSHLGFLYSKNKDLKNTITMYNRALGCDEHNPDANIGLSNIIISSNIDDIEKYNYVCNHIEKTLSYSDGLYSGYIESIYFVLQDLYYNCEEVTQKEIFRLIDLIKSLLLIKNTKVNHNIHLSRENMNIYGKESIDYTNAHKYLYGLKADIYYTNKYYYKALSNFKRKLNIIENNQIGLNIIQNSQINIETIIRVLVEKYDTCNTIGYILNNDLEEYEQSIIYYNIAINFINEQLEYYENNPNLSVMCKKVINKLNKDKLHIYINRGYAYQCKADDKKTIAGDYSSIEYDLQKAISNYTIAIQDYSKIINVSCKNGNRNYIKAYYRIGQTYKMLGNLYYGASNKDISNENLALEYYNKSKSYYEKAKLNNDIESEYLKDIEEDHVDLYIISNSDIEQLELDLLEINKKLDN